MLLVRGAQVQAAVTCTSHACEEHGDTCLSGHFWACMEPQHECYEVSVRCDQNNVVAQVTVPMLAHVHCLQADRSSTGGDTAASKLQALRLGRKWVDNPVRQRTCACFNIPQTS